MCYCVCWRMTLVTANEPEDKYDAGSVDIMLDLETTGCAICTTLKKLQRLAAKNRGFRIFHLPSIAHNGPQFGGWTRIYFYTTFNGIRPFFLLSHGTVSPSEPPTGHITAQACPTRISLCVARSQHRSPHSYTHAQIHTYMYLTLMWLPLLSPSIRMYP